LLLEKIIRSVKMTIRKEEINIRKAVRERYGQYAADFEPAAGADCGCDCGCESDSAMDRVAQMYDADVTELPEDVTGISLGCGDPVTLASLQPGQVVLDLGSGGGIDCFLAAQRVGETGRVIGVDMTAEMIDLARRNKAKLGADNVEFRLGEIENLPVADNTVDVIISNCVINLSPDKPQVFREAFRTLKPGGMLAVSDIMSDKPLPSEMLKDMDSWAGCVAGALSEADYVAAIEDAGFVDVEVEREYFDQAMVEDELRNAGLEDKIEEVLTGKSAVVKSEEGIKVVPAEELGAEPPKMFSGKVTARKP
jgi:ubiquinone/menaquinone biosynthesis C-methylase UbiE